MSIFYPKKKILVFHVGHSAGFFSEINNMILAILYCQRHDIEFKLYSKDANFGYHNGWTDFFKPFCKETRCSVHHYINNRFSAPTGKKRKLLCKIYKFLNPNVLLTYELWDKIRHQDEEISIKEIQDRCQLIIQQIYRYNDPTKLKIDSLCNGLIANMEYDCSQYAISSREILNGATDKIPAFIGMHVRRGDKIIEHSYAGIIDYLKKAETTSETRIAFVATDDYSSFEELQKTALDSWLFYTLEEETARGYSHSQYMSKSKMERANSLIRFFATIELLSMSEFSICSYSSNIGMFLGMRRPNETLGIDFENWLIW